MIEMSTDRFRLRELTQDDVSERYLSWLQDGLAKRYISASALTNEIADLQKYVGERINRADVLFLGIFSRETGVHIGNIKYEPVDSERGFAVMGILIGDPESRGKGVAGEALRASAKWLWDHRGIRQILLGVHDHNLLAIKAYEKIGFQVTESPELPRTRPDQLIMRWDISNGCL